MTIKLHGEWGNLKEMSGVSYECGFCGAITAPAVGYYSSTFDTYPYGEIYICPNCNKPTYKDSMGSQVPGVVFGEEVQHLPEDIELLYNEARRCLSVNASTSAVLACRKLLMNISVSKGADKGKNFAFYVDYLDKNHYIPPGSKKWVDHIRKKGNEATHEIPDISMGDAIELLRVTEILLRFIFEFPGKMEGK